MKIADTKSSKQLVQPKPQSKSKHMDVIERTNSAPADPAESSIRNVWSENFEEEVYKIMKLLDKYVYVAVDIEFPGIIYESRPDLPYYYTIKRNVDDLKMIQVGFSLADEHGQKPPGTSTWQFNLQFDVNKDPHSQDSIEMLRKAGIDFERHAVHGVDIQEFAQWLTISNLPFNDDVRWICFSGCFDFAYMLKLLTNKPLPPTESEFHQELKVYFPCIYDVKSITKDIEDIKQGSLNRLIDDLEIKRDGTTHQGGSDSLVTLLAFFRIKDQFLRNHIDNYKFANVIYGLNGEDNSHKEYQMAYMPDPSLFTDLSAAFIPNMGVLNYSPMNLNMMQLRYLQNFGVQKMPDMSNNFPPLMYASFSAFS